MFVKYCVFPKNFVIFLNFASSATALVFYLPGECTHTDTEGKQRKARVRNISKSSKKHNINEHPVYDIHTFHTKTYLITLSPTNGALILTRKQGV